MFEGSLTEVHLSKRTPHLHLGDVHDVLRYDDRFLHLLTFRDEAIQQVRLAVGIHDLPMRIGRLWWYEVVGERERALTVLRSVGDEALVGFCALEGPTLVAVLGNAACRSDDQRGWNQV